MKLNLKQHLTKLLILSGLASLVMTIMCPTNWYLGAWILTFIFGVAWLGHRAESINKRD